MPSIDQTINQKKDLLFELKELQSLVAVCASALKDTATCEDASVVDVLFMTSNRLWELVESENKILEALELGLEGGAE